MIIRMFGLFETGVFMKLSFLVFLLCVLISVKNQTAETKKGSSTGKWSSSVSSPILLKSFQSRRIFLSTKNEKVEDSSPRALEYNFYRDSCPQAEEIIRTMIRQMYKVRPNVVPALLRLVFHDCFVEGCDASVLLDATDEIDSEKEAPPNETLKGFDVIDIIKSELEEACPRLVSCADILVLAAREAVVQAGGPFYPLYTGRRDSAFSFGEAATYELPSPHEDLSKTIASFASRGFDERETVSLLGAHSVGVIHCKFFQNRLYNFGGTYEPDPSLDIEFLNLLRSKCNNSHTSPEESQMEMNYEGTGSSFGTLYFRSLLLGRGILYADQQLMAGEGTGIWVRAYASDAFLFRRDFAQVMMKLSNLRVLTAPMGQVRRNCSKVA
ncbi:hypothetical protein L1049_004172 [Liquidambar formosana]|uniref:Peroxidase n=1 Tax=Liquidambar formosana TaxID=63359 RepID=A0AAP0X010_LIQFO